MSPPSSASTSLPAPLAPAASLVSRALPLLRRVGARGATLFALWSIPGLISTTPIYFLVQLKDPAFPFSTALVWQFPPWQLWALATPLILGLGRRCRIDAGNRLRNIGLHLLLNAALGLAHVSIALYCGQLAQQPWYLEGTFFEKLPVTLGKNAHMELLIYWGILAVGYALEYYRRYREGEIAQAQLATQLARAQLDALRMQLHPHFLFNTLNAITVLVRKQDIPGSIRMITGISELLRIALHNTGRQEVPLRQELEFLERYLEIEQTRFQDRLQVSTRIEPEALGAQVPNLILQPLVENAIKHGIAQRAAAGRLEIAARRVGDRLRVEIRDDGPGLRPGWDARPGEHIGLANVRARLRQLYGERHAFTLENRPGGGAAATVEVPFRTAGPEDPA